MTLHRMTPHAIVSSAICTAALIASGSFTQANQDKKIAGKDKAETLDLSDFYATKASQFEKSTTYPFRVVPRDSKTLGNVPLAIGGMITLWGERNTKIGIVFPEKVEDIPVNRKFDTLYVYHSVFFVSRDGAPVYHLSLNYANGMSSMTTITYGAHLRDWYQPPQEKVSDLSDSKSKLVWSADHPAIKGTKLRFFITPITNPKPGVEVKSLHLASAKGDSAACIMAMTTGPADLLKVDKPDDK
jgi:hypothetical protein